MEEEVKSRGDELNKKGKILVMEKMGDSSIDLILFLHLFKRNLV